MKIQNRMEKIVIEMVEDLFKEQAKQNDAPFYTNPQCQLDVICYVLNRTPPRYIVSGRGLAHTESDYQRNLQKSADLVALIKEAMEKVSGTIREENSIINVEEQVAMKGPLFNFPTIMGRVFHGVNFEPISDINISLLLDNQLAPMMDKNWNNPYEIIHNTAGTYIFWMRPLIAAGPGIKQIFELELLIQHPQFEDLNHFFKMELDSETQFHNSFQSQKTFKVEDLYIFPLR